MMNDLTPTNQGPTTAHPEYDDLNTRLLNIYLGSSMTMYMTTTLQMALLAPNSRLMVHLFNSFRDSINELQRTAAIMFHEIMSRRCPLIFMYTEIEVFCLNSLILCGQLLQIQDAIVQSEFDVTDQEIGENAV